MNNKQTAIAIATRFLFCNINNDEEALKAYAEASTTAEDDVDADPSTDEFPVWQPFENLGAGEVVDHIDSLSDDIERALNALSDVAKKGIEAGSNDAEHEALVEIAAGGDE